MKCYALTPLDAWFFRDGRPYNEKEANQADVETVFPPPARTLTGAVRAALARANNWNGRQGNWPPEVTVAFGSGPNDLGKLQFTGPFLIRENQAWWPVPKHVLGQVTGQEWNPKAFLLPADCPTICDLGEVRLPEIASSSADCTGLKSTEIGWITRTGLESLLAARIPPAESTVTQAKLWMLEPRVGLHREEATLAVQEGGLYSPSYVRLKRDTTLGFGVLGVPDEMKGVPDLFSLGGESRLACCEVWNGNPLPAVPPERDFTPPPDGKVKFMVVLLTPGHFPNGEPQFKNATIISACVGKPQYFGGWDSLAQKPLPLQPFAPAGSVWFFETLISDFPAIHARHGHWLGEFTAHGFGQIAIGQWPQPTKPSPSL